jgi:hypothetical protein
MSVYLGKVTLLFQPSISISARNFNNMTGMRDPLVLLGLNYTVLKTIDLFIAAVFRKLFWGAGN